MKKFLHMTLYFIVAILTILVLAVLCIFAFHWVRERNYIPETLIEFGEKYPEAAEFVSNYPKEKNRKHTIDLEKEVTPGSIPLFIQWDKRWGYEIYGSDCLGITGCGPTCISMVLCGLTGNTTWNPLELANFSQQQGFYVSGQGTSWDLMTTGAQSLGLTAVSSEVSTDFILSNLSPESPMICSMYPGDFTYTGHFIVLTGIDSEGNIIVNDPNSPKNSEKHWNIDVLLPQIRSLWMYTLDI
ncbi:MAG: C39 family peptidase [Clostridiales bacterium]|nr:C39 family peptidase [Clostridiales bacterium]